jgi:hypothetical protein
MTRWVLALALAGCATDTSPRAWHASCVAIAA